VVLLRELLATAHGNELILGLALALWLCLTAAASALGARGGRRATDRLALLLAAAPLLLFASLWLTGLAASRTLGQEVSLPVTVLGACVALLPASVLGGLSFAWATAAFGGEQQAVPIYIAETVGSAVAGALFHFLFAERLSAGWILAVGGLAAAVAGAGLAWPRRGFAVAAALAAVVAVVGAPLVDRATLAARFPGERVLAALPTRYGLLAVVARGEQRVFFHDGVLLFTSEDEVMADEIAHLPLLLHARPRQVLLAGGGLAGGLAQVLAHRPERVDYAEMDPAVFSLARAFAGERTRQALADGRVHLSGVDARALLHGVSARYDVILVTLPVAQNARVARFSTREFLEEARRALAPGGLFALVTPGSDVHLDEAARYRHASLLATLSQVFPVVGVAPGNATVVWGAQAAVDARPELLAERLHERGIRPLRIGPAWLADRLLPINTREYRRALQGVAGIENRDERPVVYLFGLLENLERVSPALARAALWFVRVPRQGWVIGCAVLVCAVAALLVRRSGRGPGFAAAAAGATGMSLELVLMLAFQNLAGHLYHALGAILAGFMAGLAVGAALGRRLAAQRRALALACAGAATAAALVPVLLAGARALPGAGFALVFFGIVVVGAATGAVYPAAVAAAGGAQAAAHIYAWDLVGAAAAAWLVTLVAVPLLGLPAVAVLAVVLCAGATWAGLRR
jgi:spermidine synthase